MKYINRDLSTTPNNNALKTHVRRYITYSNLHHKIFTFDPSRKKPEHIRRVIQLLNPLVNYDEETFLEHY